MEIRLSPFEFLQIAVLILNLVIGLILLWIKAEIKTLSTRIDMLEKEIYNHLK